jgi:hypothetical protein
MPSQAVQPPMLLPSATSVSTPVLPNIPQTAYASDILSITNPNYYNAAIHASVSIQQTYKYCLFVDADERISSCSSGCRRHSTINTFTWVHDSASFNNTFIVDIIVTAGKSGLHAHTCNDVKLSGCIKSTHIATTRNAGCICCFC